MTQLTLLTRDGCRLCDEMKEVVHAVARRVETARSLTLTEIDISTRPDLEKRWGMEIPVLLSGEREIARHRISAGQLADIISRLS